MLCTHRNWVQSPPDAEVVQLHTSLRQVETLVHLDAKITSFGPDRLSKTTEVVSTLEINHIE